MPLYEYQCDNCNEKFEVMQKFADAPLKAHEKCGGGPVRRLLSPPTFNFKGSGWYVNDYAKSKSSGSGKDSSSSSSSSDSTAKSSESSKAAASSSDAPSKSSPSTPSSDTK